VQLEQTGGEYGNSAGKNTHRVRKGRVGKGGYGRGAKGIRATNNSAFAEEFGKVRKKTPKAAIGMSDMDAKSRKAGASGRKK